MKLPITAVLPFVSSLAVHVVVVALAVATAGAIVKQVQAVRQEEQVGAVTSEFRQKDAVGEEVARLANAGNRIPWGLPTGSMDPDPLAAPERLKAGSLSVSLSPPGGGDGDTPAVVIGVGASGLGKGGGRGGRDGPGEGTGEGGPVPFGLPTGTGFGTGGKVFDANKGARRIVFVCDATGTMINRFALLRMELARAIRQLRPVQSYNVVFFRDRDSAAAGEGLLLATDDNRRRTQQFLDDFSPSGQTNPLPALKLAFAQKPDLVYFLTDGEFNNLVSYGDVIAEIARLNPGRKVKVNTISFGSHDAEAEEVLQRIAQENAGTYKRVRDEDLSQ